MADKRPLLVLLVVAALMGGVFYFTQQRATEAVVNQEPPDTTTRITTAPSSSTSAPANADQPPEASGAVTDWAEGLKRINDLENAAFRKPGEAKVGDFMTRNCTCYQDTVTRLAALERDGQYVAGDNIKITNQQFISQEGNRVRVVVSVEPAGFPVVDANGKTVEESPSAKGLPFTYTLDKGTDGIWRLADRRTAGAS